MIENLTISYEYNGITVTLRPTANEVEGNLPYVLAPMFERVIHDSETNEEITLNELCGFFGFEIERRIENHKTT